VDVLPATLIHLPAFVMVHDMLRALPASQDRVVRRFQDLGTDPESAYDAQGLHELYKNYCSVGGCLDCQIGQHLLGD